MMYFRYHVRYTLKEFMQHLRNINFWDKDINSVGDEDFVAQSTFDSSYTHNYVNEITLLSDQRLVDEDFDNFEDDLEDYNAQINSEFIRSENFYIDVPEVIKRLPKPILIALYNRFLINQKLYPNAQEKRIEDMFFEKYMQKYLSNVIKPLPSWYYKILYVDDIFVSVASDTLNMPKNWFYEALIILGRTNYFQFGPFYERLFFKQVGFSNWVPYGYFLFGVPIIFTCALGETLYNFKNEYFYSKYIDIRKLFFFHILPQVQDGALYRAVYFVLRFFFKLIIKLNIHSIASGFGMFVLFKFYYLKGNWFGFLYNIPNTSFNKVENFNLLNQVQFRFETLYSCKRKLIEQPNLEFSNLYIYSSYNIKFLNFKKFLINLIINIEYNFKYYIIYYIYNILIFLFTNFFVLVIFQLFILSWILFISWGWFITLPYPCYWLMFISHNLNINLWDALFMPFFLLSMTLLYSNLQRLSVDILDEYNEDIEDVFFTSVILTPILFFTVVYRYKEQVLEGRYYASDSRLKYFIWNPKYAYIDSQLPFAIANHRGKVPKKFYESNQMITIPYQPIYRQNFWYQKNHSEMLATMSRYYGSPLWFIDGTWELSPGFGFTDSFEDHAYKYKAKRRSYRII